MVRETPVGCLLYTSDAADDLIGVDLGGRRIIKKTKNENQVGSTACKLEEKTKDNMIVCVGH